MSKKIIGWFIVLVFSFIVSNVFGWAEQGKAFLYIDLGAIAINVLIVLFAIAEFNNKFESKEIESSIAFIAVITVIITLIACYLLAKLFNIDFYAAYQIMTFGACLWSNEGN